MVGRICGTIHIVCLSKALLAALVGVVVALSASGPAAAKQPAGTVYYQVTSADGKVRDVNEVPRTAENIRRVLRISRFEPASAGYRIVTTEAPGVITIGQGRTVKHDLVWNGTAWVGPDQRRPKTATTQTRPTEGPIQEEIRRTKQVLEVLQERLKECDRAVGAAERKLTDAKGTDAEPAAKQDHQKACQDRKKMLEAIEQYNLQLEALMQATGSKELEQPTGQVEYLKQPPGAGDLGVVKPITEQAVLPHRVHVWKLPPHKGRGTYTIQIAHPEAGRFGAFYYVAYADKDADGLPDKLIARSPLAEADLPGRWSQWTFTTSESAVFAGNACADEANSVYCRPGPLPAADWHGLETEVHAAPILGVSPKGHWTVWPYLTNIQIHVSQD